MGFQFKKKKKKFAIITFNVIVIFELTQFVGVSEEI